MPDVIIVDDEPLARQGMRQLLASHHDVRVIGEAGSAAEARSLITALKPDAVFLDIEMADASGFAVLRELEDAPAIIFVTAHAAHAVAAFDVKAVDYLLKPVRPERLAAALARLQKVPVSGKHSNERDKAALQFKTRTRTIALRHGMLVALQAEGDYTRVIPANADPLLVGQSIGEIDALLPHPPFARLGRSLVINGDRLREVLYRDRDETQLSFEGHTEAIVIGRAATMMLRKARSPGSKC